MAKPPIASPASPMDCKPEEANTREGGSPPDVLGPENRRGPQEHGPVRGGRRVVMVRGERPPERVWLVAEVDVLQKVADGAELKK